MTLPAAALADSDTTAQVDDCYYHIDAEEFEAVGESLEFKIWQRLCWEGRCRFCKNATEPKPTLPMPMRNRRSIYAAIKYCANLDTYILANMSVLEVAFRILLRNGNAPMRLFELVQEIEKEWESVLAIKSIAPATVQQMLDGDNEYRIRRTDAPSE